MNTLTKTLVGTVAAGAMAASAASPALARDRDGIDAGEVIAGALIIGGIAAVAAAASDNDRDRYRYRDRRGYRHDRYGYGGYGSSPRQAVSQCVRAAEQSASRYSYGRANVTDIRKVRNRRNGYDVNGRIAVDTRRGWRGARYDTGKFKCKVRYGRVADLDYSGIRGLR